MAEEFRSVGRVITQTSLGMIRHARSGIRDSNLNLKR